VRALAALDAYDVLIEYLNAPREVADPVERVGEDAVINAVAYALAGLHEERILELLLKLAETRILLGVILALGGFGRIKTIPFLVEALADDECRPAAEAALRKFGTTVREALLVAATACSPPVERESDSSLRRRRRALALLIMAVIASTDAGQGLENRCASMQNLSYECHRIRKRHSHTAADTLAP
jgi:HEAT repeat protein